MARAERRGTEIGARGRDVLGQADPSQAAKPSTFVDRSDLSHAPYLIDKTCEQGRGIVPSPCESERDGHVQVDNGQDGDGLRTPPACASEYPADAQARRDETKDCRLVKSLLNDVG
jgi:hypothetical protein